MATTIPALAQASPFQLDSPRIRDLLDGRGVSLAQLPGESTEAHHDRLDTELMALFRDTGFEDAFDALYRHARARVFQWVRWLVRQRRCALDPVDVLQDTFVNVYRYAHAFRSDRRGSFRSWVRTIAANALRRALMISPRSSMQDLPEGLQEPIDPSQGPQLRMVNEEEAEALSRAWLLFLQHYALAFDSLSPRDRRALGLVEVEGYTYAEAAAELEVGSSNMKMIMLRSRRRLQKKMRAAMFGPERAPRMLRTA